MRTLNCSKPRAPTMVRPIIGQKHLRQHLNCYNYHYVDTQICNEMVTKNYQCSEMRTPVNLFCPAPHCPLPTPSPTAQVSRGRPCRSTATLAALITYGKMASLSFPRIRTESQMQQRASARWGSLPTGGLTPQMTVKLPPHVTTETQRSCICRPQGFLRLCLLCLTCKGGNNSRPRSHSEV